MTAEKRRTLHLTSLQACQIAVGHLKASSEGCDPTSVRSAMTYIDKAWDACQELKDSNINPLNPEEMLKHEQQEETIQQPAGSPAGDSAA
jgi:hypothetical protein